HRPYFWGIWQWSQSKPSAKDLLTFLSKRNIVTKLSVRAAAMTFRHFCRWRTARCGPQWSRRKVYDYPLRPTTMPGILSRAPAPARRMGSDLDPEHDSANGGAHGDRPHCEAGDRLGDGWTARSPALYATVWAQRLDHSDVERRAAGYRVGA